MGDSLASPADGVRGLRHREPRLNRATSAKRGRRRKGVYAAAPSRELPSPGHRSLLKVTGAAPLNRWRSVAHAAKRAPTRSSPPHHAHTCLSCSFKPFPSRSSADRPSTCAWCHSRLRLFQHSFRLHGHRLAHGRRSGFRGKRRDLDGLRRKRGKRSKRRGLDGIRRKHRQGRLDGIRRKRGKRRDRLRWI
jgi:hypothetical protein